MTAKLKLIDDLRQARDDRDSQLHTTTWLLKRLRQMKSALQECEDYFDPLATYEWLADGPSGNREAQLLEEVRGALNALAAGSRRAKTPKAVECEASQSGPKGNAQKDTQ